MKNFVEAVNEELSDLRDILSKLNSHFRTRRLMYGFVEKVFEKDSDEWDAFGPGSVGVHIPDLVSSARLVARPAHSRVPYPKEKEFILVQSTGQRTNDFVYWGKYVFEGEYPGLEEVILQDLVSYDRGFVDGPVPYRYGGHRQEDADDNPGTHVIVDSRTDWIIGARETPQEVDISVNEGWRIVLAAGDTGSVYIGARDPQLETESVASGAAVDITLDGGTSGNIELKSSTGGVTIDAGSDPTESMVLGETLKAKLEALIDEINLITVNTPLGPSSVPNNAANFSTLKSELTEILSANNVNN